MDGLIDYGAESIPGTTEVVNPSWRALDQSVRQTRQQVRKHQADLARAALTEGNDIQQNAESLKALQAVQAELAKLCAQRKATPRKVTIESLPEAERPSQRLPLSKMLSDAVKNLKLYSHGKPRMFDDHAMCNRQNSGRLRFRLSDDVLLNACVVSCETRRWLSS